MADSGDFLAGLVIGGLMGFVAGVLLAPAPGSETREILADRTQSAVKHTRAGVEEVSSFVKDNVDKVADLVKDALSDDSCTKDTIEPEEAELV